jgi:Uma2 family endonuclease
MGLLRPYALKHKLGRVASEKALIALIRNDYEPDVCFWNQAKANLFTADQMKLPAPDLVIEVLSKGTARRDRGVKFIDYVANGIAEYWIINPGKQTVEQYELDPDIEEYSHVGTFLADQEIESKQVIGFRVPVLALFDEKANMHAHEKLFFAS